MINAIAIFAGGGLGSLARYYITRWVFDYAQSTFPYATIVVNFLSCLILGLIIGIMDERFFLNTHVRFLIVVGFCGGFSTFSAFTYDNFELIRIGQYLSCIGNILVSVTGCVFFLIGGIIISKIIS